MNSYIASAFLIGIVLGAVGTYAASVATPACGASSSSKNINLVKPTNPPRECEYHIKAYSKYVCQLRIEFALTLAQPTLERQGDGGLNYAECTQDYFEVNGLRLCGVETWQHIYVPFNATAGVSTVDLRISLANRAGGVNLPEPYWDMRVKQLECPSGASVRSFEESQEFEVLPEARATIDDGFYVAPPGCLQYFPHASGAVKSFNYNDGAGMYPSKMNYALCFRRTAETTVLNIRSYYFQVGAERAVTSLLTDNLCYRSGSSSDLQGDYLMVPQATLVDSHQHATYFCGATSGDVVIQSNNPGPLLVLFNSDDVYGLDAAGFAFTYTVK